MNFRSYAALIQKADAICNEEIESRAGLKDKGGKIRGLAGNTVFSDLQDS